MGMEHLYLFVTILAALLVANTIGGVIKMWIES